MTGRRSRSNKRPPRTNVPAAQAPPATRPETQPGTEYDTYSRRDFMPLTTQPRESWPHQMAQYQGPPEVSTRPSRYGPPEYGPGEQHASTYPPISPMQPHPQLQQNRLPSLPPWTDPRPNAVAQQQAAAGQAEALAASTMYPPPIQHEYDPRRQTAPQYHHQHYQYEEYSHPRYMGPDKHDPYSAPDPSASVFAQPPYNLGNSRRFGGTYMNCMVGKVGFPPPAPPPAVPKTKFTQDDDKLLVLLKEEKKITWRQIADFFPMRNPGTLQVRYCTKLRTKEVVWSEEALQRLETAVMEYERDRWKIISNKVGTGFSKDDCEAKVVELEEMRRAEERRVAEERQAAEALQAAEGGGDGGSSGAGDGGNNGAQSG